MAIVVLLMPMMLTQPSVIESRSFANLRFNVHEEREAHDGSADGPSDVLHPRGRESPVPEGKKDGPGEGQPPGAADRFRGDDGRRVVVAGDPRLRCAVVLHTAMGLMMTGSSIIATALNRGQ
jgi:hypothetical protein